MQHDRRTRRNAQFTLESLDDRIVLSAAAAGTAAEAAVNTKAALLEQKHEAKLAKLEARHEATLAKAEARHEAKLAKLEAKEEAKFGKAHGVPTPITINSSTSASTTVSASPAAVSTAPATTASSGSTTSSGTTTAVPATSTTPGPASTTANSTVTSSSEPLPANVGAALQSLYSEYESAGGGSTFTPSEPTDKQLVISGTSVGVNIKVSPTASFNTILSQLESDGLQVTTSSASYGLIDGMLPIADLGTVAQLSGTTSVTPSSPPMYS
jgi:hypothetical protein